MGTSSKFQVYYEPENGYKYLQIRTKSVDIKDLDAAKISLYYLENYVFNEYIFDSSIGNNLLDFFNELEESNVEYYIATTYRELDTKHSDFCIEHDENISRKDLNEYLNDIDLETIDMNEYLKYLGCKVNFEIILDANNLEEEGFTIDEIEKESKKYYNGDDLTVDFSLFDFTKDEYYILIDYNTSYEVIENEEDLNEYVPEYSW